MITVCQICKSSNFKPVIDLGFHPLADTFLKSEQLREPENTYPLVVAACFDCSYAGLTYIVPASMRYQENEYSYTSSNSSVSIKHFAEMAKSVSETLGLTNKDLAIDIGSNVGELLASIQRESGARILGFEPAANIAALATEKSIPTINDFFSAKTATLALAEYGQARLITSTNTFNHITDLQDFAHGLDLLLEQDGAFVFEVPYLVTLLETRAFDTIYLEHVSYFSVHAIKQLFGTYGFNITNVETNEYMGGSMRVMVQRAPESPIVAEFLKKEKSLDIFGPKIYENFMNDVKQGKLQLCKQLYEIKTTGKKVLGIGAATKGNTLLNYCRLDNTVIDYISDTSSLKIGKYTPGSHIPIVSDDDIPASEKSEIYALILPWNIAAYLQEKLKNQISNFIIPNFK